MPLVHKMSVLAAAIEAEVGTAETLDATDAAFNVFNAELSPNVDVPDREGQTTLSRLVGVAGALGGRCTFEVELYQSAAWAPILLPACGMKATSSTWTPSSTTSDWKTLTIGRYVNGKLRRLTGAMGTATLNFQVGLPVRVAFEFTGIYAGASSATILTPTYPLTLPPRWAGSTLTVGAYGPKLSTLSVGLNNTVTLLEDATKSFGYHRAMITDRAVGGQMNPEDELVATYDADTAWLASTQAALSIAFGSMSLSVPKLQWTNAQPLDRGGVAALTLDWRAARSAAAGDDELSLNLSTA